MSATAADHLLERLANGARRVYGATVRRQLPPTVMQPKEALVPAEPAINDAITAQGAKT